MPYLDDKITQYVLKKLSESGWKNKIMLVGGMAVQYWTGRGLRDTPDLDLIVNPDPEYAIKGLRNIVESLAKELSGGGYDVIVNLRPQEHRNGRLVYTITLRDKEAGEKLDLHIVGYSPLVLIKKNDINIRREYEKNRLVWEDSVVTKEGFRIASPEWLALYKAEHCREKDYQDVKALYEAGLIDQNKIQEVINKVKKYFKKKTLETIKQRLLLNREYWVSCTGKGEYRTIN